MSDLTETLDEARAAAKVAEANIASVIEHFNKTTGLRIEEIGVDYRATATFSDALPVLPRIAVKVKLPWD